MRIGKFTQRAVIAVLSAALILTMLALPVSAEGDRPTLRFGADGKFRIIQLTDLHFTDENKVLYPTNNLFIKKALEKYQPDLVVYTGDSLSRGPELATEYSARRTLDMLLEPVVELGIPFAVAIGNHDYQNAIGEAEQLRIYSEAPGSLVPADGGFCDGANRGNYFLTVKSFDGARDAACLWFMDSGSAEDENAGFSMTDAQIDWYSAQSAELAAKNGGEYLPSLAFQHIPVGECATFMREVDAGTPGAVENDGKYYILDGAKASGTLGQAYGGGNNAIYDRWTETGVIGAFFGHDHLNDTVGVTDKGIKLCSTPTAGFHGRNAGKDNGVRVIDLDENDLSDFETFTVHYSEFFGPLAPIRMRYFYVLRIFLYLIYLRGELAAIAA